MPNVVVGVQNKSRSAQWELSDEGVQKTSTLVYLVVAESLATSEESIRQTPGIPQLGNQVGNTRVIGVEVNDEGPACHPVTNVDSVLWSVEIEYDSQFDSDQNTNSPTTKPVRIRWSGLTIQRPLTHDAITGDRVENFVGEAITGINQPLNVTVMSRQKYVAYPFDPGTIATYSNTVNNAAVTIGSQNYPRGTGWLQPIRTNPVVIDDVRYEDVFYQVHFLLDPDDPAREYTWQAVVPHLGRQYVGRATGAFRNEGPKKSKGPWYLRNADGLRVQTEQGESIEYLRWNRLREANWPSIGVLT